MELIHNPNLKAKDIKSILILEHKQRIEYLDKMHEQEKDFMTFSTNNYLNTLRQMKKEELDKVTGYE